MNIDRSPFANQTASVSPIWHYATGIFSFLCLICGLLSNSLVIFVFIRHKNLQRPRNYFLINLAVTDLGLLLTNNILHTIASFNKEWPFGQIGCNFYALSAGVFGLTSIATMMTISLTRLSAVINPFSSLKLTGHFTLKCIVCSWIYGSVWIIPPLFGWNRFIFEGFGTTCSFDYISREIWDRLYVLMLVTGGFFIPFLIILVSYIFILFKLSKRHHLILLGKNYESQRITRIIPLLDDNRIPRRIRDTEARATHTALLVCALFCAAWGPYALMAILSQFGFDYFINDYTTAILGLLTKTAACINPLVYALSLSAFRQHLCLQPEFSQHRISLSNHR